MTNQVMYHLRARSPFHLGERGVGIEETSVILHADTLFSAICLTLRETGADLEKELFPLYPGPGGAGKPPFTLSSAFPYAGPVHLFPRPMQAMPEEKDQDAGTGKKLKKIRFVSQPIFEKLLTGESPARWWKPGEGLLQNGQVLITPDEANTLKTLYRQARAEEDKTGQRRPFSDLVNPETGELRFWQKGTAPRVTVDRINSRSQVYAAGRVTFVDGGGLYFLVSYTDESWRERVEKVLRVMGETGIGGERSSGHGQFALEGIDSFSLQQPSGHGMRFVTLSPCWPTEAEVRSGVLENADYSLLNRRGWIGSPDGMNLRRKGVRMLGEGATLEKKPIGALANVTPDPEPGASKLPHPVYRYGLAFPVPCRPVSVEKESAK